MESPLEKFLTLILDIIGLIVLLGVVFLVLAIGFFILRAAL